MPNSSRDPLPYEVTEAAREIGERVKIARKRRRMTQGEVCAAAGFTRKTLVKLESGSPGVSLGVFLTALWKLGLLSSTSGVADPNADDHGKTLELARLPQRVRTPKPIDNDF